MQVWGMFWVNSTAVIEFWTIKNMYNNNFLITFKLDLIYGTSTLIIFLLSLQSAET